MQTGPTTGGARPAAADMPSGQRTCIVEEPQGLGSCFLANVTTEKAVPLQCHSQLGGIGWAPEKRTTNHLLNLHKAARTVFRETS